MWDGWDLVLTWAVVVAVVKQAVGIEYYNFGWEDMTAPTLPFMQVRAYHSPTRDAGQNLWLRQNTHPSMLSCDRTRCVWRRRCWSGGARSPCIATR